ncbi:MAG: ribosome hibernation-promoting factor, HPF/YfiA family [Candidatus Brocadiia bacterium]
MQIELSAHHLEVTDELRGYVQHLADRLEHFFDGVLCLHVTLQAEKERRIAELVANVSHGPAVVAKVSTDNAYASLHKAADKVEAQLRKHKDKIRDHHHRGPQAAPGGAPGAQGPAEQPGADDTSA